MSSEPQETEPIPPVRGIGYVLVPLGCIAMIWAWYLIENFTDWRITRSARREVLAVDARPLPIAFPLIGAPLIIVGGYLFWRRAKVIVSRGAWVTATITKFGMGIKGLQDVTLEYNFGDKRYRVQESVDDKVVEHKEIGDTIRIVVDQKKPTRFQVPGAHNSKLPKTQP